MSENTSADKEKLVDLVWIQIDADSIQSFEATEWVKLHQEKANKFRERMKKCENRKGWRKQGKMFSKWREISTLQNSANHGHAGSTKIFTVIHDNNSLVN